MSTFRCRCQGRKPNADTEREKKQDKEFQQKERERKRAAYVPVTELSAFELKKRRKFVNARVKKCMKKRREILKQVKATQNERPGSSTRNESITSVPFPEEIK